MGIIRNMVIALYIAPRSWVFARGYAFRTGLRAKNIIENIDQVPMKDLRRMGSLINKQEKSRTELLEVLRGGFCTGYAASAMEDYGIMARKFRSAIDGEIARRSSGKRRKRK